MSKKPAAIELYDAKRIGMFVVVASVVCIVVLYIADFRFIFEPPYLLPVTNTLFAAVIPVAIAFFAARIFIKNSSLSIFLMGCGMLSFGISAAMAGWLRPAQNGANLNVTVYNTGALAGALFHIAGALFSSSGKTHWRSIPGRLAVTAAYTAIFAFIVLFTFATLEGLIPFFFVQGQGPTALRQVVLGLAIFFYLLSAVFFMDNYQKTKSVFFYWYSLGLAMMAFGLFAFFIQKGVGSPIGWAGRITNYIGSVFALTAVLASMHQSRRKGQALEDVISGFFLEAEASLYSLVEAATDAIVSYDRENRIILWNSGAGTLFGYTKEETTGAPFLGTLIPEKYVPAVKELIDVPRAVSGGAASRSTAEIEVRRKDGTLLPVEISAFARELPVGWVNTCFVRDITERKQAREALEKMKNILSEGQKIGHVGTFEYEAATQTTVWSEEEYRIYGLDPAGPSPPYDLLLAKHIHPDDAASLHGKFTAAMQSGSLYEIEHRIVRPDGNVRWLYNRAQPYFDGEGKLIRYVGVTLDITDRKQAEERREEDLAALTRMHALSGMLMDKGGLQPQLQEVMDAAVAILKADRGTLQLLEDRSLRILAHHGHREPFLEFFASAENRASVCGEALSSGKRVIVPDVEESALFAGTPSLPVLREAGVRAVLSTPLIGRGGELLGILTAQWGVPHKPRGRDLWRIDLLARQAADLIQYVRTEETLRADLEVMTRLQRLGSLFLQEGNMEAILTQIVDAAIAITGADFGNIQLLDPRTQDLKIVAHRGFPQWWLDFWNRVSEGRGSCGTALRNGERVVVEDVEKSSIFAGTEALDIQLRAGVRAVQSTPLVSRAGKPLGMFSTHHKAPHRLDEHTARLLDLLARHAADTIDRALAEEEIKRHASALEEANRELESFSYSVSHDLRAPLRAIDGFSRMLMKKHGPSLDGDSLRKFGVIRENVRTMGQLIEDLLALSRLGRTKMSFSRIAMDALVGDLWKDLSSANADRDIRIAMNGLPDGYGDTTLLRQAWMNLLANAVKYTKTSDPALVEVGGDVRGGEIVYFVKDNGIGFDMSYHDSLFQVFQRLHNAEDYEGTGVGLAIVSRVVHRHGGRVWAEGQEGKGATFYFTLPSPPWNNTNPA